MAQNTNRPLKAYVRFDGTGRIVPSSLILRRKKPKVGRWVEIPAYECCNYVPTSTTTTTSSSTSSTTTTTTTAAPLFSTFSVKRTISASDFICLLNPVDVYTAFGDTITTGTQVFTDTSLTTPLTGYEYIVNAGGGIRYNMDELTGIIGSDTGNVC